MSSDPVTGAQVSILGIYGDVDSAISNNGSNSREHEHPTFSGIKYSGGIPELIFPLTAPQIGCSFSVSVFQGSQTAKSPCSLEHYS